MNLLNDYIKPIIKAKKMGYKFLTGSQHVDDQTIMLRHDIDIQSDIMYAMKMLAAEDDLGVKSTWFFRLYGDYNLFSKGTRCLIACIQNRKHEIGFHADVDLGEDLLTKGWEVFTKYYPDASLYTEHMPSAHGYFVDKYSVWFPPSMYSINSQYISDSGGRWGKDGSFNEVVGKHKTIQVLTHPSWWI